MQHALRTARSASKLEGSLGLVVLCVGVGMARDDEAAMAEGQ